MVRVELNKKVDIAIWPEVTTENRTEKRQSADVISPTKLCDLSPWQLNVLHANAHFL